jgi:hypothetical protein
MKRALAAVVTVTFAFTLACPRRGWRRVVGPGLLMASLSACSSGGSATHTTTHDCSPVCGSSGYCDYPLGPGSCPEPGADGGLCPAGCPGCPAEPAPSCSPLPSGCGGSPTCECLLATCPGGCGAEASGTCTIDADGDWVIKCLTC